MLKDMVPNHMIMHNIPKMRKTEEAMQAEFTVNG